MTQKDQEKIMRIGFQIIRRDYQNLLIKQKDAKNSNWHNLESGFASKAALDRRMKELLELDLIVED
ncbi:MAG: hypothetical protein LC112_07660 [Flavobacteriales bacterium]|nr:hypothetical protein [Flavobacteriales bacterium]